MKILNAFFGPTDETKYPPCGMFTLTHIIALICFVALIVIALILTKKMNQQKLKKITKIVSIVLVILETIKIIYNIYYKYTWVDSIIPLHFCSLFIYSTLMAGFGKNKIEKFGSSYIVGAGIVCGGFFLIFPTTSLTMHPIYHYLSLYSMLYHSLMIYLGIMYLKNNMFNLTIKNFLYYVIYCVVFYIPALIINGIKNSNLMFLREPYKVPLKFLATIQSNSQLIYTLIIMIAYLLVYLVPYIIYITKTYIANTKKSSSLSN